MDALLIAVLVGIPLAWLVGFAVYAYLDAPNHGMSPRKWAAISFFVPLFGFFAYLFEREERDYDPEEDPYATGETTFAVHESRRGEAPLGPAGTRADERRDDGDRGRDGRDRDRDRGVRDRDDESDEWNDPPGVDP